MESTGKVLELANLIAEHFLAALVKAFSFYFRGLDKIFGSLFGKLGLSEASRLLGEPPRASIDERLAKIETAKANLLESLQAIDDLKEQAEENKRALQEALITIATLEKQKASAKRELETIQQIASLDSTAVRKLFDFPTQGRIWRERIYGLMSGIAGSIIATIVWTLATHK